jgi:hypothetical protein
MASLSTVVIAILAFLAGLYGPSLRYFVLETAANPSASATANTTFAGLQNHEAVPKPEQDYELDYPLEWVRGSNVPCVLSAQGSV